jgi:hypothetical protein
MRGDRGTLDRTDPLRALRRPAPGSAPGRHARLLHRLPRDARQALEHLLDPLPRTPEKWLPLAQRYAEAAEMLVPTAS